MDEDIAAAIRADQQRRAAFDAKVAALVADGYCIECARGYHINHVTDWRPSVLDAEPINGAGECPECPCEWRA